MKNKYLPEIKICGITNLDDARAACDAGADYLGFVLYKKSPRAISPVNLRRLLDKISRKIKTVGVFVNEPAENIAQIADDCGLNCVQLCGDEKTEDFKSLSVPVWRVIRMKNNILEPDPAKWPACNLAAADSIACPQSLRSRRCRRAGRPAERYVLDAAAKKNYGGTGKTVDWPIAARFALNNKIMLAGGLTPENVTEAIRVVHPFGVDVASGVEREPGKKDHKKILFFIEAVKKAV